MSVAFARFLILGVALVLPGAALAQQGAPRAADVESDQLAPLDDRVAPPLAQISPRRAPGAQPTPQIKGPDNARAPVDQVQQRLKAHSGTVQVAPEKRGTSGSPQLGAKERSARGASAISKPSDGRQTAIIRLGGIDRCDPQSGKPVSAICKSVIETRSAEFKAPTAPASPEQRLLIDQERAEARTLRSTIQRVGRNEIDVNSIEAQTLAAITAAPPATAAELPGDIDPSAPSALESIIQIIGAAQGAPSPN